MRQARSLIPRWLRRAGLAAAAALAFSGAYGHIEAMDDQAPFDLVSVGPDRRLHALCDGPKDGPSVIYDAGAFGIYADGWWIKEALRADYRVCLYDRAGLGWSDPVPEGETPDAAFHVEDIRRLAAAAGLAPPYYLVGHSMAGLRLHAFANLYPGEIAGLVFVDAAAPQRFNTARGRRLVGLFSTLMGAGVASAQIGLARAVAPLLPDELKLPPQPARDKRRAISAVRHHRGARAEVKAADLGAAYFQETLAATLPVSVFSAGERGGGNAPTAEAARRTAGFGRITPLPGESHVSVLNEENARKIAADIRAMTARFETAR